MGVTRPQFWLEGGAGDSARVARDEAKVFGGGELGEADVGLEGGSFTLEGDGCLAGVEDKSARGLNSFSKGEIGCPHGAAGARDLAAGVEVALRDAEENINGAMKIALDARGIDGAGGRTG